jgi:nucleoside-diphosphate-sugar epimerase
MVLISRLTFGAMRILPRTILPMSQIHTVLGATGALGSAIVHHLAAEGRQIRALARNREIAESMLPEGVEIRNFDPLDVDSMRAACEGSAVLYNCVYLPEKLGIVAKTLRETAQALACRVIFPSNGDVYGPAQTYPIPETHPHAANSERGKRRIEIELMLTEPNPDGLNPVTIVRLPSLYGAHMRGSFMSVLFESAMRGQKSFWLGSLDAAHGLCYLPDAAAACVLLAEATDTSGEVWHVSGGDALSGRQFMEQVYAAFGTAPNFGVRSRTLFSVVGAILPDAKRLAEVIYQFEKPFALADDKFTGRFPGFAYTPRNDGIADTVAWYREEHST